MSSAGRTLRVGCVQYLNARPVIHGWPGKVHFDHPATLCEMLAAGRLDVAFVSSFEYLRDPAYQIVDGVSVAAEGPVYSVFVAHREPIEEITEIRADQNSRTSVNLLRCLLAERKYRARLTSSDTSAKLLIGDQAIRFRQQSDGGYTFWDLADEWHRLTRLPFVFALWLIRADTPDAGAIADQLRALCRKNVQGLAEVIAAQSDFPAAFCDRYFREHLRFAFGEREKQGLLRFRSLCEENGLLAKNGTQLRLI